MGIASNTFSSRRLIQELAPIVKVSFPLGRVNRNVYCLELCDPEHRYRMVQRTNNVSERFFRSVKRFLRRITGKKKLNREVNALTGQAFLIFNLKVPAYMKLICGNLDNLAQAFAELSRKGEFPKHVRLPSPRFLDRKSRCSQDFPNRAKAVFPSRQRELVSGP